MTRTDTTAVPDTAAPPPNPIVPSYKPDWPEARRHWEQWWRREGMVLAITAPLDEPRADLPKPPPPADARDKHIGIPGRILRSEYAAAHTFYGGDAIPTPRTMCVGPGDLAPMLGAGWKFSNETVWYEPCIDDPDTHPPLTLDRDSFAFRRLTEMIQAERALAAGRYMTGVPDLIENIDILAALRDPQTLLMDMYDRPEWIERSMFEINQAWFAAFDHFWDLIKAPDGSGHFSAFGVWATGKAAKIQCDACSMFGPEQFGRFVVPAMTEQCEWLDFSVYHLDGEECWPNLDHLLAIDALDAIQWTPKFAYATEGGAHPKWHDLYRRIKAAGKSVVAIAVKAHEVIPLIEAVGPEGLYITARAETETEARAVLDAAEKYRP